MDFNYKPMKNTQRTTNCELRTYRAFTLIELVVAVALLAVVFAFTGLIFRVGIDSYRTSAANAEIMQKLRAITDQLNSDFGGLRKDGEIFVIWKAASGSHERFDRIMFFADGDFESYSTDPKLVRGPVARICYMLGNKPDNPNSPIRPFEQNPPQKRILSRTQHILTDDSDPGLAAFPNFLTFTNNDPCWVAWNNLREYDKTTLDGWKNASDVNNVLTVIMDVNVGTNVRVSQDVRGTMVDPADANLIHNIFCEGVGEFKVQGWYDAQQRWVPEWDDSDFYPEGSINVPGVLYPFGIDIPNPSLIFPPVMNEANFNDIPGLGRALKFTFTLYDSRGVIKQGRTFTHIVYIGN